LKIAKKKAESEGISHGTNATGQWWMVDPSALRLFDLQSPPPENELLEDGLALLRTMDAELKQLESLVKRRGHTNDPTEEISSSVKRLEVDMKELSDLIKVLIPPSSRGQHRRHYEILQQWFQSVTQKQGERLKETLKVRGAVLAEQAQRRKMFQTSSAQSKTASRSAAYSNPLFTIKAPSPPANTNGRSNGTLSAPAPPTPLANRPITTPATRQGATSTSYYNYYSSSTRTGQYGAVGSTTAYGGGLAKNAGYYSGHDNSTGMRQRRHAASQDQGTQHQQNEQAQMLIRQQERQTQRRLQEARQTESSLAELGTLFSKMSSLITQQSEVIDKVEDDVEAALFDVTAGQQEITTLYSIKKGNRALILKVFGLLIFFIIFMRLYRN